MNILLLNHYAGSPEHGMEYRPFYLAREWVKLGHAVTIIGASQSHLRSNQPSCKGDITEEEIEGIHYIWLKTPSYRGNGIGRVLNMLTFIMRIFRFSKYIISSCKPDVVIASSTYPLDIYPAYYITKKTKAQLIFEVHDLWPLSPIELGGISPRHPFIMVMQWAENFAYRVSDSVVSMLPKANGHMYEHGMAKEKFFYVPNGINVLEWEKNNASLPIQHKEKLIQLRSEGKFIIGYAGAHGLANALYTLVDAAELLKDQSICIVCVGQGPEKEKLEKLVLEKNIKNIIFLPSVTKSSIPEILNHMDALYIGLQKQSLFRFGISPNKLMDYMMAGKPVIHAIDAGNDLVADSGCGISVSPENPEAIASAIMKIKSMTQGECIAMGLRGKEYVIKNHDYKILAQNFIEIMNKKNNRMNILLINHYAGSPNHGMEYRSFYLAREWVKLGHRVTIVGASQSHLRSVQPICKGAITEEEIEGIQYIWLNTPSYYGNGMRRVLNMLIFIMRLFFFNNKIINGNRVDCVIASSTYPLDIYPAYYITKKTNAKLVFEVHDLWPLSPIELGGISPWHPFIIVMQQAENFAYRVAHRVVSMLPKAKEHMCQHGMRAEKFSYISNGIDINEWQSSDGVVPEEHNLILNELKEKSQFIVGYAGSHGVSNALAYFIEAAHLLKEQSVTFVLVGQGPEKEILQKRAIYLGLDNVIFLPAVSKMEISALLNLMDILYIGWNRIPIYRFGIGPNKLFDYMMAAKPIIHSVEAGNDLVAESGCGLSISPENPEEIVKAILKLKKMTQVERTSMGLRGRDYVIKNNDYKVLAKEFFEIVR